MKIKDVVQESVYDWFTQRDAARAQAGAQQKNRLKIQQAAQQQAASQQAVGQFKSNPARTATATTDPAIAPEKVELTPGVRVVKSVDPIILSYNNKNYTRQPNGQWTKLGQTKPVDLPTQQFLSSELAKL